jgi:ACR3 family arsenite transporter
MRLFGLAAKHGRAILILGLVAGVLFPGLALQLKPWIGILVAFMLFLAALRVGPRDAFGAVAQLRSSLAMVLVLQIVFPVLTILAFGVFGLRGGIATGLILMMAAPPISGAPNLTLMTGNDPAPALRQLLTGTALLALTVIPVFWLAPDLGSARDILGAASRLLAVIASAGAAGFLVRAWLIKSPSREAFRAFDGLSALTMAVMVVGLMSAVGPAMRSNPSALLIALAAAFAGNFGQQILMLAALRGRAPEQLIAPAGISAGNRNIALFLTALPASVTDPVLLFIGCYQIPMYLTPVLLGRLYRSTSSIMHD